MRSAKHLLEQSYLSNDEFYQGLLNLRNVSRDCTIKSPAQRLMSRVIRPPMPIAQQTLVPRVLQPSAVQQRIAQKHEIQCRSHDKSSRPLSPLLPGQVVRLQTSTGFSKLATVVGVDDSPRSYLVNYEGTVYRRSRQHLLAVREPKPPPAAPYSPPPAVPPARNVAPARNMPVNPPVLRSPVRSPPARLSLSPPAARSSPSLSPGSPVPAGSPLHAVSPPPFSFSPAPVSGLPSLLSGGEGEGAVRTRSGRIVRPSDRYGDFA